MRPHLAVLLGVVVLLAAGCDNPVSTNSVEVLNLTDETLMIHKASGDEEPREVPPRKEAVYAVQRDGCMDDRLVAMDPEGNVVAEKDRPCGGTQWVLQDPQPTD